MTRVLVLCGVLVAAVVVIAPAAAAAPAPRTETVVETDGDVQISHVRIYDPLPAGTPPHPEACDYIDYLRYRMTDGPSDPQQSDTVLVGSAGAWLGSYGMDALARNTLRSMAARGTTAEWWSLNRRSVCAFDMTGLEAAHRTGDGDLAFRYYYEGAAVDGKRFAGFPPDSALRYLTEIGLRRNVEDTHKVIVDGLPDPEFRRTKTFCGGHSDGGLIMAAFGAWDFTGRPQDAGFNQCAGFFAVDSLIVTDPVDVQKYPQLAEAARILGTMPYEAAVSALRAGLLPPTYNGTPVIAPEAMAFKAVLGAAAYYAPTAQADLHRRLPATPLWDWTFRTNFARTTSDFLTGQNSIREYRFTNEALLGVLHDDNHLNLAPDQLSLGALGGGPVAPKEFPMPDSVARTPGLAYRLEGLIGTETRMGPTDKSVTYTWHRHDDVPAPDAPYARAASEVVDIHDWARMASAAPGGATGYLDPYYTMRYTVDLLAAFTGARGGEMAPMKYDAEVAAEPIVTIFGTESWTARTDGDLAGMPEDTIWVEGYTHIDPVLGAAVQNNGKPEPVADALSGWVAGELP